MNVRSPLMIAVMGELFRLEEGSGPSIAEALGEDPQKVGITLRRLRDLGFARQVRSDKPAVWTLTDAGQRHRSMLRKLLR